MTNIRLSIEGVDQIIEWDTATATNVSSIFSPRDESDTGKDVFGNTLEYSGLAKISPYLEASNCGTFD